MLIFDFTDVAKLLSSRVWEWCCFLDATGYCQDCRLCAGLMGVRGYLVVASTCMSCGLMKLSIFCVHGLCVFFPFVTYLFKFPSHFFFLSLHPKCKMCPSTTQLLTQALPLCHTFSLFPPGITSICIMAPNNIFRHSVCTLSRNKASRSVFTRLLCIDYCYIEGIPLSRSTKMSRIQFQPLKHSHYQNVIKK